MINQRNETARQAGVRALWQRAGCLALMALLLMGLVPAEATAAQKTKEKPVQVRIYLASALKKNVAYSQGNRAYDREWVQPEFQESHGVLYRSTQNFHTYFYPVRAVNGKAELHLTLPADVKWTTAELNGKLLSADQPVTVNLGDTAVLYLADKKKCCGAKLMFTTLPVVAISTKGEVNRTPGADAVFTLVDPDFASNGWKQPYLTCSAVLSRRGQSASMFKDKHPFNLSLMKDGEKWDHRLLGMRNDSDWMLDSAYSDALRMRNRVLMDIWDEIYSLPWNSKRSGVSHGAFVEVLLNGRYKGIFVLAEKQDRKQLGLKKTGSGVNSLLIKTRKANTKSTSPAGFFSMGKVEPGSEVINEWHNVTIKYPKAADVTRDTWKDFYDLTNLVVNGSDEEFARKIGQYVDLKNLALYYVFINSMDVMDNMRKNMTFARYSEKDKFILVPWDMDASLGRYYSSKKSREKDMDSNPLFDRLIALDVDGFNKRVSGLWNTYKDSLLSVDHVMEKINAYYDALRISGAAAREMALYPNFVHYLGSQYSFKLNFEVEIAYVRKYMDKHYAFIDAQFKNFEKTAAK